MGPLDRLARAAVTAAARRWPPDLADDLRAAWLAELATLTGARRKLAFAGSLAVSPAVDEPSWASRAAGLGRHAAVAAGVTLLAAALANTARAAGPAAPALLLAAVAAMVAAGARVRVPVALVGGALSAFLWVGNPVPVMPFLGAADIVPAVATWTLGTAITVRAARRRPGHARPRAFAGGLTTLVLATAAGSWHAAAVLGVPAWTAPAWFPLALLPGGVLRFGPGVPPGAAFGPLRTYEFAHASDILLANAAVTAGPMLLCTALLLAGATVRRVPHGGRRYAGAADRRCATGDARIREALAGVVAALAALAVAPLLPGGTTPSRMLDNATVFGFGFAVHPLGQGALALLVAVLTMRATRRPAAPA